MCIWKSTTLVLLLLFWAKLACVLRISRHLFARPEVAIFSAKKYGDRLSPAWIFYKVTDWLKVFRSCLASDSDASLRLWQTNVRRYSPQDCLKNWARTVLCPGGRDLAKQAWPMPAAQGLHPSFTGSQNYAVGKILLASQLIKTCFNSGNHWWAVVKLLQHYLRRRISKVQHMQQI